MKLTKRFSLFRLFESIHRRTSYGEVEDSRITWGAFYEQFGLPFPTFSNVPRVPLFTSKNRYLKIIPVPQGLYVSNLLDAFHHSALAGYFDIDEHSRRELAKFIYLNFARRKVRDYIVRRKSCHGNLFNTEYQELKEGEGFPQNILKRPFAPMSPLEFLISFMYECVIQDRVPKYCTNSVIYFGGGERTKGSLSVHFQPVFTSPVSEFVHQDHIPLPLFSQSSWRTKIIFKFSPESIVCHKRAICLPILLPK
jgi:hypothetical protein